MDQPSPALRMRRRIPHLGPWRIVEDQNPLVLHLRRGPRHTAKDKDQCPSKLELGPPPTKLVLMEPFEPGFAVCKMLYVEVPVSPGCSTGSSRETTSHTTPSSPLSFSSSSSTTSSNSPDSSPSFSDSLSSSSSSSSTDISVPDLTPLPPPLSPLSPTTSPLLTSGVSVCRPAWIEKLQVLMNRAEQVRSGSRKRPLEESEGAPPGKRSFHTSEPFFPTDLSFSDSDSDMTPSAPQSPLPPQTLPHTTEPFFPTDLSFSDSDSDLTPSAPQSPLPPQTLPHTTEPFFPTDLSFSDSDSDSALSPLPVSISRSSPLRSALSPQSPPLTTASSLPSCTSYSSELLRSESRKRPLEEPEEAPPRKRPANI